MKRIITGVVSVAVATLAMGGVFLGTAHAATGAPWEPDPTSSGGLTFYDSSGTAITGGSTSAPIAAFVEGDTAISATDSVATLFGFLPKIGKKPGEWSGEQLSGSTTYPNAAAPGALGTATLPVVTGAATDETVAELVSHFPNTDTSTTDGYARSYEIRVITSKPQAGASSSYDSADIQISPNGQTWSLYSGESTTTPTTTTLAVSPSSGKVVAGASVTLTATVSPAAAAGTVAFKDGSKTLKSVAASGGSASYTTKTLKVGSHSLTAAFTPTASTYDVSTSATKTVTVKAVATKTTLKASSKKITVGKKLKLTATEKPAVAGKITFLDGKKSLGKVKVTKGKATFTTKKLKKGTHKLTAKFVPSGSSASGSTSKAVKVKVVKS